MPPPGTVHCYNGCLPVSLRVLERFIQWQWPMANPLIPPDINLSAWIWLSKDMKYKSCFFTLTLEGLKVLSVHHRACTRKSKNMEKKWQHSIRMYKMQLWICSRTALRLRIFKLMNSRLSEIEPRPITHKAPRSSWRVASTIRTWQSWCCWTRSKQDI